MLYGRADLKAITAYAPEVGIDRSLELDIGKVEWLQFTYELSGGGTNVDLIPPGLHPTTPVVATLQLWRARGGTLGDFGLAQLRLSCRAGMRIRAYLLQSVIDGGDAAKKLTTHFGYGPQLGRVIVRSRADCMEGKVEVDGRSVFEAILRAPSTVDVSAIQHIANLNPARTAEGLTLLQVDPDFDQTSLKRGEQKLLQIDTAFWRMPSRSLKYPIIGVAGEANVRIPAIAYTQNPEREKTSAG